MKKLKISHQRFMLSLIVILLTAVLFMATLLFLDIDARSVYDLVETNDISYINVSTVYLQADHVDIWNDRYESESTEFIYCLYGENFEDGFLVDEIKTTEVINKDEDSISYKRCERNKRYLGNIHSHPQPEERYLRATCDLSKQDLFTFGSEQQVITGIICGNNKIALYGVGNFENSYTIKIMEDLTQ